MTSRGKPRHVQSDLGDDDLRGHRAEAGDLGDDDPPSAAGATAVPFARQRVAMDCAAWLARRLASVDYRAEYAAWRAEIDGVPKSEWVDRLWSTRTIRAMRQFCSAETDNQSLWGAAWAHQLSIQLAHGRRHAAVSDQS